ncbi:MAG: CdaR family protein [Desulfobulbales bacterium]|nr:CdaR family protein [Desulfobulbales bacterium]
MEKLVKQITGKKDLKLPEKLPKNLLIKLVSFFFAVFLWYFVVGEDKVDITLYVPLEITNLPQNLVISNEFRKQLEVTVNGPRGLVRTISGQQITRPVDLSDVRPGNHVIKNTPESIKLPNGIQIQNIRPANITLTIDRLITKELPVKPVVEGEPATGYEVSALIPDPPILDLTAPAGILGKEMFLPTQPIDISGRKDNFTTEVSLDVRDQITELIGEPAISVNVLLKEKQVPREFHDIPVEFSHAAQRTTYWLDHHYVDIKATMPYHLAEQAAEEFQFQAVLEADRLPAGNHTLPVKIVTNRPDIVISEIMPPTIEIRISPPQPAMKKQLTSPPPGNGSNRQ